VPNIWQMHGPAQGLVALHVPLQVGNMPAFFCSCTAEAVPAQRTPRTSAVKNVSLTFFSISFSFLGFGAK
jgi:hypothetical protein